MRVEAQTAQTAPGTEESGNVVFVAGFRLPCLINALVLFPALLGASPSFAKGREHSLVDWGVSQHRGRPMGWWATFLLLLDVS